MYDYKIFDPCGNITALVRGGFAEYERGNISKEIMAKNPTVEQVGFVDFTDSTVELTMAGGEFCGNACACSALYHYTVYNKADVCVKICGMSLNARVNAEKSGYSVLVDMPKALSVEKTELTLNNKKISPYIVDLGDIKHIILCDIGKTEAENNIKKWAEMLNASALGIMIFDEEKTILNPLVYVRGVDTLFWERSCASGSTAVLYYLHERDKGDIGISITQPGGVITGECSGGVVRLKVAIKYQSTTP